MNGKSRIIYSLAAIIVLTIVMVGGGVLSRTISVRAASPESVQVVLDAPDEVSSDSEFTVTIDISQIKSFDAASYNVSYDPAVLRLDNVTSGEIGETSVPVDIWNEIDSGVYTIVQNVPGLSGLSGSGYLAVLHFHVASSQSGVSTINLSNGTLSNNLAKAIPATWTGDSLNVLAPAPGEGSSPTSNPPTPELSALSTTPLLLPPPPLPAPSATGSFKVIDKSGVFTQNVTAKSADGKLKITIRRDTVGLTRDKKPLSGISMFKVAKPLARSRSLSVVGSVYYLGPDGAIFEPPITLTLTYVPDEIPKDADEKSLVIAYWDEDIHNWVVFENSKVDTKSNTVTASISHFTTVAVLAYIPPVLPASLIFNASDLRISPAKASSGETVTIGVVVSNSGTISGDYEVTLKLNGTVEKTQTIKIAAGESKDVSFTTSKDIAGSYSVDVNGLTGTFTVKAKPLSATATKPSEPAKPAGPAKPAEPAKPAKSDEPVGPFKITWTWMRGLLELVGAAIVLGILVYFAAKGKVL